MPMNALPVRFEGDPLTIDLHMHSTASDGALAPDALVALCHERGLSHMALTDHDTMDGVATARAAAAGVGLCVLPATELSTQWRGINIHVVGLLPDGARGDLVAGLVAQAQARERRSLKIAERMEKVGLDDALARAREQAGSDRPLGRPDFARALVAAGLVPDMSSAFAKYLGNGKAGDIKAHWPYLSEAVAWILDAGGVAVLAHPLRHGLTRRKRGLLLDDFRAAGGQAAELVSAFQNPDVTRDLARQLQERELLASVGSDFHFPGGHLAPGTMSPVPRTAVAPVWTHPRLAACLGQPAPAA
ncbi:PHP domain-containing protein [Halomonas sp. M4R1S46]|uniref:PHP domain-containing protein n=1 Tax=Halomonas sp. M4R1S46 TaxID=2982692 RepID=UPI0021E4B6D1|nr:PHP domain-containing protein [Halomonas sp. M4R1S46]UYG08266.1 PHP domain-containing protein [Halomonas sp. M4R1S46]